MPAPALDDIRNALQVPAKLRLALNTLQGEMPPELESGGVREMLFALRDRLEEVELREIRTVGPQEYLLIKPLAPAPEGNSRSKRPGTSGRLMTSAWSSGSACEGRAAE